MRQPTSRSDLYRHYWRALEGDPTLEVHDGEPHCGWYKTKLVTGGPWVPVEIRMLQVTDDNGELTEPERMVCTVAGERRNAASMWTFLEPIPRAEHDALMTRKDQIPAMAATKAPMKLSKMPMMRPK